MTEEWMNDARKIPNEPMGYLRKLVVRAIAEKAYSPELLADIFGISRSSIYEWLKRYREGGWEALESRPAPGAPSLITPEIEEWLRQTVLEKTPPGLWLRDGPVDTRHPGCAVAQVLWPHRRGLSYRKPRWRPREQSPAAVERFVNETFPRIRRLADKLHADIAFEDEAGIGLQTQAGKTWGERGTPPEVPASGRRGGVNLLSAVTAQGTMHFSLEEGKINTARYIAFLKQLTKGRIPDFPTVER
jgi:transposase